MIQFFLVWKNNSDIYNNIPPVRNCYFRYPHHHSSQIDITVSMTLCTMSIYNYSYSWHSYFCPVQDMRCKNQLFFFWLIHYCSYNFTYTHIVNFHWQNRLWSHDRYLEVNSDGRGLKWELLLFVTPPSQNVITDMLNLHFDKAKWSCSYL